MQCREEPDGRILLTHDSTWLLKLCLVVGALLLILLAFDEFRDRHEEGRVLGVVASSISLALAGLVFFEQARVEVDPASRTIRWSRRRAWYMRKGVIPFDRVQSIEIETPIGDEGIPSRRICVRLKTGRVHPLSMAYTVDLRDAMLPLADRLRVVLGLTNDPSGLASVEELVGRGETIAAVRSIRQATGASLEEALRQVREIQARRD